MFFIEIKIYHFGAPILKRENLALSVLRLKFKSWWLIFALRTCQLIHSEYETKQSETRNHDLPGYITTWGIVPVPGNLYIAYGISDLFPATMVSLNPIRIMKHQADEEKAEVNIPEKTSNRKSQCWGSVMTFWWDPDPTPDPTPFFSDFKVRMQKIVFFIYRVRTIN